MIVAFIGDNGHAREQAAAEFVNGFTGVHGSMAVDKFAGEELELAGLADAISTVPFLSPRRLVIARNISTNKILADQIDKISELVADTTDLVLIEGHVDGRSKFLTNLKKIAEVREFHQLDGSDLVDWIIEQTKQLKGTISPLVAQRLIDRVGTNQQLLANEISKLVLYQPEITEASLKQLTVYMPQSSIFAMLDAAFAGNISQAMLLYAEQRTQGMEPQAIMGMLTWQLHVMTLVKAGGPMSAQDIATKAKLSPFVVRKNQANARRISDTKLMHILEHAIAVDKLMKTTRVDNDDAVRSIILSFA